MSSAVYKALSRVWSFQPDDKSGSDDIFQHQERRQNKGPARDDGREVGAGLGTPTFHSGNEAKHNVRLRTWKSKPKNTKSKVQSQGHLQEQKSPRALRLKPSGSHQDPPGLMLLETVFSTVLPLQMLPPTSTHLAILSQHYQEQRHHSLP